jgi:LysM repeat protein/ABC-type branched-subunit amino acid transport system substrate-binding protein
MISATAIINAQELKDNELVIINGQKYIVHQVKTGETIYSLSRNFRVEPAMIMRSNPGVEDGLNIGDRLKIPFDGSFSLSEISGFKKGDPTGFKQYTIESNNETAYSVSRKFGVNVEEIYSYNPELQKLKKGLVIRIPVWEFKEISETADKTIEPENSDGNKIIHTVVSGETLYGICRKYNVSESDVLTLNPDARNLKAGAKIQIPSKSGNAQTVTVTKPKEEISEGIIHSVEPGETIYGITKKYGISESELKAANPGLVTLQSGMKLNIPQKTNGQNIVSQPVEKSDETNNAEREVKARTENCTKLSVSEAEKRTYSVALFLPLFLDANADLRNGLISEPEAVDSLLLTTSLADTLIESSEPAVPVNRFHGNSENFLQFYEGVLVAVDSMQKAGMNVKMSVYDTKDSPENVRKLVNSGALKNTDLIIGPVYENVQKEVASFAETNQIPMVSPFIPRSSIISNNPYFFQVNPTREYLASATVEMIRKEFAGKNFVVIKTGSYEGTPEGQLVTRIQQALAEQSPKSRFQVYDFKRERARGLRDVLIADSENVVFIPTADEGELSVAISNLNNLADEIPITLVAQANFQQRYQSIDVAHFHNLKMHYINPYWVDYNKNATISYVRKFRANFGTEPNSYGIQGFDVAYYFLNALFWYGNNFTPCVGDLDLKLVQGNYHFAKVSSSGGFMNQGVSVVQYNRNFEVQQKEVLK